MSYPQDPYDPPMQPLPFAEQPQVGPRKKPKKLLVILGVIGGLLVLCCGGMGVIGAMSSPQKPAPSASKSAGSPSPSPTPTKTPTTSAAPITPAAARTTAAPPAPVAPAPATTTEPAPPPPAPTDAGNAHNVHAGSFCSPEGALGYTSSGTLMRCTVVAGESRARWRKA